MKGLNKITCCLLAALLMPCAGHAENEQYGANFNNADIRQFVEIVGQHLGKTILIDPSVQGTISVRSNDTFSQQEYYQFFLSILDLYGYSVITLDNGFLKVVRSANVKTSPGMIADSSRPGVGDELVTRIVPLENVPARDLAPLLRQMMDAGSVGNVVHYEPSNVLILTGRASTINKLIEVIKRVDVIGTEKQQIIHLEYASAEDLAEILNQLISESHGKSQMPALLSAKIVADKRTNSLIISGPEKARQRITSLLKSLDVEESEEGNTRVTLLEMMLVLALVAITASVVLFTYGREDVANTRARETAARFTAALELAIDRATLSGQPVGIHFSDSAWRIMVPGKTPSAWRWVPLQEDAADESQNDWDEELSIHLQPFKPDDSNQPQVVILADGQITPFSLLMANAGTGEPLLTLVCSGSWPLDQTLARDTRP